MDTFSSFWNARCKAENMTHARDISFSVRGVNLYFGVKIAGSYTWSYRDFQVRKTELGQLGGFRIPTLINLYSKYWIHNLQFYLSKALRSGQCSFNLMHTFLEIISTETALLVPSKLISSFVFQWVPWKAGTSLGLDDMKQVNGIEVNLDPIRNSGQKELKLLFY